MHLKTFWKFIDRNRDEYPIPTATLYWYSFNQCWFVDIKQFSSWAIRPRPQIGFTRRHLFQTSFLPTWPFVSTPILTYTIMDMDVEAMLEAPFREKSVCINTIFLSQLGRLTLCIEGEGSVAWRRTRQLRSWSPGRRLSVISPYFLL